MRIDAMSKSEEVKDKITSNVTDCIEKLNQSFNKMSSKISSQVLEAITEKRLTEDMKQEDIYTLLDSLGVNKQLHAIAKSFKNYLKEEIKSKFDKLDPFKSYIKRKWNLRDQESETAIDILVRGGVIDNNDHYKIKDISRLDNIEANNQEKVVLSKITRRVKAMNEAWNDQEIPKAVKSTCAQFWDALAETIHSNINYRLHNNQSLGERSNFENKYYKGINKIRKELKDKTKNDADYINISDQLRQAQKEGSTSSINPEIFASWVENDVNKDNSGYFVHLVVLSRALKCPIRIYNNNKLYEELGTEFPARSLKISFEPNSTDGSVWRCPLTKEKGSIYSILGKQLQKSEEYLKELLVKAASEDQKYLFKMLPKILKFGEAKFTTCDANMDSEESKEESENTLIYDFRQALKKLDLDKADKNRLKNIAKTLKSSNALSDALLCLKLFNKLEEAGPNSFNRLITKGKLKLKSQSASGILSEICRANKLVSFAREVVQILTKGAYSQSVQVEGVKEGDKVTLRTKK